VIHTCPMLSDKAKGKQRAVESLSSVADLQVPSIPLESSSQASTRNLVVRFTEGLPDLIVPVNQQDAVRDVKKKVNKPSTSTTLLHFKIYLDS
jgi:hypothetical protein